MKWITREHVKVDRVACPWLIRRFVDPGAEFLFVPADRVMAVAEREGATPYDVEGVELGHHGKECSVDADQRERAVDLQRTVPRRRVSRRSWASAPPRARRERRASRTPRT